MFVISTFYKIIVLPQVKLLRDRISDFMRENCIRGTILLSGDEGINGTISGSRDSMNLFYEFIALISELSDLKYKESFYKENPFDKIKVKIKSEIVTLGKKVNFTSDRGEYIRPCNWDDEISKDDVVVLNTCNDYECMIGTFDGAVNPGINNFRDLPEWFANNAKMFHGKKVLTFCTGGIRAEKFTAYLIQELGVKSVYQLEGGILAYLEQTGNQNGKWHGSCFVFDNRIALNEKLEAI